MFYENWTPEIKAAWLRAEGYGGTIAHGGKGLAPKMSEDLFIIKARSWGVDQNDLGRTTTLYGGVTLLGGKPKGGPALWEFSHYIEHLTHVSQEIGKCWLRVDVIRHLGIPDA